MKPPILKLATWADYADVVDQRMTILRAFSYMEVESLPVECRCIAAIQIETDDLQSSTTLLLRLKDYEGTIAVELECLLEPHRTLTDRFLSQIVAEFHFELKKHEYSLEMSLKENGAKLGELALPVVTKHMLRNT